jgi:PAS domain S-box-containing protein
MLDSPMGAYAVVDPEGKCLAASGGLLRLAGIDGSPRVLEGRSLFGVDRSRLARALESVARGESVKLEVERLPFWDNRIGSYQVRFLPLSKPSGGDLLGALMEVRPLTAKTTADAQFRRLVEEAPCGVCVLRGGRLLYANPAALRVFGYTEAADLVGRHVRELVEPLSKQAETSLTQEKEGVCLSGLELKVRANSGRVVSVQIEIWKSRLDDGAVTVLLVHQGPVVVLTRASPHSLSGGSVVRSVEGPTVEESARAPTVLVCDDEARLAMLTAGLLDQYGYRSLTVSTGRDAVRALTEATPSCDVVLLDLNLPDGSAAEVIQRMRLQGLGQPVILTSGYAEEDIAPELLADPLVAGYLAKPYSVERLVEVVRHALERTA